MVPQAQEREEGEEGQAGEEEEEGEEPQGVAEQGEALQVAWPRQGRAQLQG